jgi:hypothetical protein
MNPMRAIFRLSREPGFVKANGNSPIIPHLSPYPFTAQNMLAVCTYPTAAQAIWGRM